MYQSYPALYTHAKNKHPEAKITNAKKLRVEESIPILKLKTILKVNQKER